MPMHPPTEIHWQIVAVYGVSEMNYENVAHASINEERTNVDPRNAVDEMHQNVRSTIDKLIHKSSQLSSSIVYSIITIVAKHV